MKFLQILSTNAWQNITYHCQNSFAWQNKENKHSNYLKMLGDNELEYHALNAKKFRPLVIQDDCKVRNDYIPQRSLNIKILTDVQFKLENVLHFVIGERWQMA